MYERKKQLNKLRTKAEKVAEERLGSQLDVLAPVKYWKPTSITSEFYTRLVEASFDFDFASEIWFC